jgi:hypothetical protein
MDAELARWKEKGLNIAKMMRDKNSVYQRLPLLSKHADELAALCEETSVGDDPPSFSQKTRIFKLFLLLKDELGMFIWNGVK